MITATTIVSSMLTVPTSGAGFVDLTAEVAKFVTEARGPVATGKIDEAMPKSDRKNEPKVAEGEHKIEIPLPSDHDMDRMMSFLEKAWRRLIEMANRVQKDVGGKI